MGEVYRASDTNLKRAVAIKVLPESVAADRDRLARFQREAEVLASLNHSNIAAIYGLERSDGVTALVMEMVEGPTLADRIAHGPIPIDEALSIAKQIAEALESAHEHGIIHRDLKPANIKLRDDGTVKVLDFGLAKAMEPTASAVNMSRSPTITSPAMMTGVGVLLGTAAYMAPEQARGKPVDKRADIWAFGCVLYEMLTGQRAFGGDDVTVTLSRVVEREPDFDALPATVPPASPSGAPRVPAEGSEAARSRHRGHSHGAGGRVRDGRRADDVSRVIGATRTVLAWMAAFAVAAVLAAALAIPTVRHLRETPPPETRTEIVTPATDLPASFALSPDGRQIVFVASGDATSRLWLRSLATTTAQPLAGHRGGRVSILETRQPVNWVLRGRRAEAARPRWRCTADPGFGQQPARRDVEHGRRDFVFGEQLDPQPHTCRRRCSDDRDDAQYTAISQRAALSARRPPVSVLRARWAGYGRDLLGYARRQPTHPADASRGQRGVSARGMAAVGAGRRARGPAAGPRAGGADGRSGSRGRRGRD